jgi:hypothetical protein
MLGDWLGTNVLAIVAFAAIVVAWLIYRRQQSDERQGLLRAIEAELQLHGSWVGNPYQWGCWPPSNVWWSREQLLKRRQPGLVYKLSTVAVNAGIERGPALFINPSLVVTLVQYRQRASQLNQLVDLATDLLAAPDMWKRRPSKDMWERYALATADVHWTGIGTAVSDGAHKHFVQATTELRREQHAGRPARFFWFAFGRTWRR